MRITREALYREVWRRPLNRLAVEFNVTPVLLSELCRRYKIPTPEPGYWTKREMGKPTAQPSLGPPPEGLDGPVTIPAMPVDWPDATTATLHPLVVPTYEALAAAVPTVGMLKCSGAGLFSVRVAPSSIDRATRILSQLLYVAQASGSAVEARG